MGLHALGNRFIYSAGCLPKLEYAQVSGEDAWQVLKFLSTIVVMRDRNVLYLDLSNFEMFSRCAKGPKDMPLSVARFMKENMCWGCI